VNYIDGLKIELLHFQQQSVQWAFEREIVSDGIQSYFWTKLSDATRKDIYFNPLVGLKWEKPRIVRGGYIAEEMGLGKTVISLALILKNPAPENPTSGSPISFLEKKDPSGSSLDSEYKPVWDKVMRMDEITHNNNNKRGSIISQGTLVIVSLLLRETNISSNN
jgi:SNF2 family DNA or RNA helicase